MAHVGVRVCARRRSIRRLIATSTHASVVAGTRSSSRLRRRLRPSQAKVRSTTRAAWQDGEGGHRWRLDSNGVPAPAARLLHDFPAPAPVVASPGQERAPVAPVHPGVTHRGQMAAGPGHECWCGVRVASEGLRARRPSAPARRCPPADDVCGRCSSCRHHSRVGRHTAWCVRSGCPEWPHWVVRYARRRQPRLPAQRRMQRLPGAIPAPASKVAADRLPLGELAGQQAPRHTATHSIEHCVQYSAHVNRAGTPARLSRWNEGCQDFPLTSSQIRRVGDAIRHS